VIASPVQSHADRPVATTQLPFRVVDGTPKCLEYTNSVTLPERQGKREIPFRLYLEPGGIPSGFADPLPCKILELMQLFWKLEADRNGLLKRIDDGETEIALLRGEIASLKGQLSQFKPTKNGKGA